MQLLNDLFEPFLYEGRLAVKEKNDDSTVYVVWEVDEEENRVKLVELDRAYDGEPHFVDLEEEEVYLLEPLEVVERVKEWN